MIIQNLVDNAAELVESKFKMRLRRTTYKMYRLSEWYDFCNSRDSELTSRGIFLPREMSAHLLDDHFLYITLFHEYFGHGLFCEYSTKGQQIVRFEEDLAEIEREMFGDVPTEKIELDKSHRLYPEYKTKREEALRFSAENIWFYEGFAVWIEGYLSEKLGYKLLFDLKMGIIHPLYRELLNDFTRLEKEQGIDSLLYTVEINPEKNSEI